MSKLFFEILTEGGKKEFSRLRYFAKFGFLVGGTALALQINHRHSYDFDVFSLRPLPKSLPRRVKNIFGAITVIKDREGEELTFTTATGIKITFFYYPFAPLYPRIKTGSISLISWKDIALDKAYTIGRRALWRDYVDLFCLIKKRGTSLSWIIRNARKKFGDLFSEKLFLGQLAYLADIKPVPIEFVEKEYDRGAIEIFLKKEVERYLKTRLAPPKKKIGK